jgi:glycosyltransferase involved in cell wall biosynthesis
VDKIKVLFLYPNEVFGSVWTVHSHIIKHLDRDRFTPYVVLNSRVEGDSGLDGVEGIVIRHWEFGTALRESPRAVAHAALHLPRSVLALARWARREGIDVVHCAEKPRISALGYIVARYAGARLLLHYHNMPESYAGARPVVENAIARRADRAVAVSKFIASRIVSVGVPASKVDTVINGVNLRRFRPDIEGSAIRREYGIDPGAPLVLQLGRICEWKRQEDLVRAFAIARRSVPDLRCLLVGWIDPRPSGSFPDYGALLEQIREEENLGESLIVAPARPEAPQLMAAADIFALPSTNDPCPLVVTEAMAAGKPVIGADSGGIPEMVVEGLTGFLAQPRSPEELADKLILLAADRDLRTKMGSAARRRAETHFDEGRLAGEFAPIYESLVRPGLRRQKSEVRSQKSAQSLISDL